MTIHDKVIFISCSQFDWETASTIHEILMRTLYFCVYGVGGNRFVQGKVDKVIVYLRGS